MCTDWHSNRSHSCASGLVPAEVPRYRRCCFFRASTSYKGIAVLTVVALVSMVMVLYARERVQTYMAQTFSHSNIAEASASQLQVKYLFLF